MEATEVIKSKTRDDERNEKCSPLKTFYNGSRTRIPRPINGTSRNRSAKSSDSLSKSSDGPIRDTNNHSLYKTFYQDLKIAFKSFRAAHPNEKEGTIHLSSRYFDLCWTLNGPHGYDILYGNIAVFNDKLPLNVMMYKGRKVSVVKVGVVDYFPLDGALLYYCDDDDMLYFFPLEGLEDEPEDSCHGLHEFRHLGEMIDEFP